MKFQSILKVLGSLAFTLPSVYAKSQDYARHLELSLLFYEAQRSGPLPASNRIYWRKDSMTDAGADNNVDLNGGYYDAGDNVKFNYPQAATISLLAFSAYKWKDGFKDAEQWGYIKDCIKWGTDYFLKCHTGKTELYGQVGNGSLDHGAWVSPEDMTYDHPSYKIDAQHPGSDLAAETAASLAAAYLVFKDENPSYAETLLKHAKELYDFADKYQDTYTVGIEDAQGYYRSFSGYKDELVWGAAMLLLATGDETYRTKVDAIWDYPYNQHDPDYFLNSGGPISWDDKKASSYALMYMITHEDKYKEQAFKHSDLMVNYKTTPGGLWYDTNLSAWGSNRYASNAAFTVAMVASTMDKDDSKRKQYVKFIQKQVDYIQGDNPAKVDYVVGADPSSPKSVHHRGSSGTSNAMGLPSFNVFPLYGALAGGPGANDDYKDDRTNYNSNEVALDYNAAYTGLLAFLIQEGLNVPDPKQTWDGAWPPKESNGEITVKLNYNGRNEFTPTVASSGGLTCGGWCVEMDLTSTGAQLDKVWGGELLKQEGNLFVACAGWGKEYLDGKGTEQNFYFRVKNDSNMVEPTEAFVYCNGYHRGDKYLVNLKTGTSEPYGWTKGICKPAHICDANGNYIKDSGLIDKSSTPSNPKTTTTTTTIKTPEPTNNNECFAAKQGYKCCATCNVAYTDGDGDWGFENNDWCGITGEGKPSAEEGDSGNGKVSRTTLADGGILETGVFTTMPPTHTQAPYPDKPNEGTDACSSKWHMQDGVCVAMYCEDDPQSENCDGCGGVAGKGGCVAVDSKTGKSGIYPEVHDARNQEWKYSRSTHYGLTYAGACAFGVYGLCSFKANVTMESEICQTFCKNYPDLCEDPVDTKLSLRGNFIAPNGNYYTQFWSSLPGDYDNYLSCGECYELEITKEDGSLYPENERRSENIIAQIVDSCPCSANAKWCCGSGIDHCSEIDFKYGCPIPEGSWHVDLSDIAMSRLQTNDPYGIMVDGVIPIRYKRVPCPVKGNIHVWLRPGAGQWYFALTVVNVANMGSLVAVEVQQSDGKWVPLVRDPNYSSTRPQERYGSWTVKQGTGPFTVPMNMRFTDSAFNTLTANNAIKDFGDPSQELYDFYYIDTGVQFPMPDGYEGY